MLSSIAPINMKSFERIPFKGSVSSPSYEGLNGTKTDSVSFSLSQDLKFLREAQKTFQETFMRDDISLVETKEMLDRYKEIEKIEDKEEYIKAMYEEAKKNYGFGDIDLPLILEKSMEKSKNGETMGSAAKAMNRVSISLNAKRDDILNYIHHELRHIKQDYCMLVYSPFDYLVSLMKEAYKDLSKNKPEIIKGRDFKTFFADNRETSFNTLATETITRWGGLSKETLPKTVTESYIKKCIKARENYATAHENNFLYHWNFLEVDARKAGEGIEKIIKNYSKN